MEIPLYTYDEMPREMRRYLSHNGWHFNKKSNDFAVSLMRRRGDEDGSIERIKTLSKDDVEAMLAKYGVEVENKGGYDYVYVANMCIADYYGSSIDDEQHLSQMIKDICDDVDAATDSVMICWYAKMKAKGLGIPWEDLI